MRHYVCKCGKAEYFGSGMVPQACEGCEECGTNYHGEPLKPHDWGVEYDRRTGLPYRVCKRCYSKEKTPKNDPGAAYPFHVLAHGQEGDDKMRVIKIDADDVLIFSCKGNAGPGDDKFGTSLEVLGPGEDEVFVSLFMELIGKYGKREVTVWMKAAQAFLAEMQAESPGGEPAKQTKV